ITDGEVRRLDGYVDSYYAIIKGIEPLPVRRKAGPWGYDQQTRYEAPGRIETPPGGLGIIKEFAYLKAHTTRRTKATCAGPLTFGSRTHPGQPSPGGVPVAAPPPRAGPPGGWPRCPTPSRRGPPGACAPSARRAPSPPSSTSRRAATCRAR